METTEKPQKKNKRGTIISIIMITNIVIVFILTIFSKYWHNSGYSYRNILSFILWENYPLDVITYIMPFIGIIYLAITKTTKKIIKYSIWVSCIILLSIIIQCWFNSVLVLKDYRHEYFNLYYSWTEENPFKTLDTWFNLLYFIKGGK